MMILGISGSPRKENKSGVHRLVQTVLETTGIEYEFVSLRKKNIAGCIACLGCVKEAIQAGIREIVYQQDDRYEAGLEEAYRNLVQEAGLRLRHFTDDEASPLGKQVS